MCVCVVCWDPETECGILSNQPVATKLLNPKPSSLIPTRDLGGSEYRGGAADASRATRPLANHGAHVDDNGLTGVLPDF